MTETAADSDLVKLFLTGNHAAFNELVSRYQTKIYWHARKMTGNHLDADDIMQEVLLVIYEKLHTFQFNSSLYTWIYKITATRSLNHIRKVKLRKFFSLDGENTINMANEENVALDYERGEQMQKLDKVMQNLPNRQREVFILRNFELLSYEEISKITGKSTGSLKASYFHALGKVTNWMKENG